MKLGMRPCCFCGEPVDGKYREIHGWEERRARGGANKIIKRTETGRQCCNACASDLKSNRSPGQLKAFD